MENGHADGYVTVKLDAIADLARCPICMGILKETRTISVCMHRFCRTCIEAWLRTNIDNTCPQCRESFASRRNCKADPSFDQLLSTIFGANTTAADDAFLEPPSAAIAAAKAMGSELMILRETQRIAANKASAQAAAQARVAAARGAAASAGNSIDYSGGATGEYNLNSDDDDSYISGYDKKQFKRPASSGALDGNKKKRPKGGSSKSRLGSMASPASASGYLDSMDSGELPYELSSPQNAPGAASTKYYGVRYHAQAEVWTAYGYDGTIGGAPSYTYLGRYSTEEEAARIYDLHKIRQKGGKSGVKLNFPYLVQAFKKLLSHGVAPGASESEYEGAVQRVNAAVQGVVVPHGWKPPLLLPRPQSGGGGAARPGSKPLPKIGRPPKHNKSQQGGPAVPDMAPPAAEYMITLQEQLIQEAIASAQQLSEMYPSAAMLGPDAQKPSIAVVEIRAADGVGADKTWNMKSMSCPANSTIAELAGAIAEGITSMHLGSGDGATEEEEKEKSGVEADAVQLNAANELDASADFMSVYNDIDNAGAFALKPHLRLRDLMLLLADGGEDLVLEYSIKS